MYDPLEFWEKNARNWLKLKHDTDKDWEEIKEFVNPDWKVLELGCGSGRWAKYFNDYTGTDIAPSLVISAQKHHPDKQFFHHDMRFPVPKGFDLIFTYTAWEHVPPEDIKKVKLPNTRFLFIEPTNKPSVDYCFKHNYEELFGVKKLKDYGQLTIYGKLE